ncbi:MAG: response regulator [Clostridiales bacterium]|nr:response regulator [Clostridiales bacterium]
MRTLLIVEDEKLIRQGIRVMIQRSGVPVENIIECSNGQMALEVLKNQSVDVMLTDIRMPKMDGIELVKEMQKLPHPPLTVAISGYDDFSYAVEMMRGGVREYLLKPVDRDSLREILEKLDRELADTREEEERRRLLACNQLRQVMESAQISLSELQLMEEQIGYRLFPSYEVCCFAKMGELETGSNTACLFLGEMSGGSVCIVDRESSPYLLKNELHDACVGVSRAHSGIAELREAYLEAAGARKIAFCRCLHEYRQIVPIIGIRPKAANQPLSSGTRLEAANQPLSLGIRPEATNLPSASGVIPENASQSSAEITDITDHTSGTAGDGTLKNKEASSCCALEGTGEDIPSNTEIEKLVQLLGTDRCKDCRCQTDFFLRKVKRGIFSPQQMEQYLGTLLEQIRTIYGGALQEQTDEMASLQKIYGFQNVEVYADAIGTFFDCIHSRTDGRSEEHRNQQKLLRAVRYIQENFSRDLNMAVVSNYVSMNYSVFSQEFKQYTGKNFVTFLKELRMEEAKRLLMETDLRVIEISQKVGYENDKHFMKTFKATYGVSPSEFRKNMGFT